MSRFNLKLGIVLVSLLIIGALFAPWIAPHDPGDYNLSQKLMGPHENFYMGNDADGSCVLSRILYGGRISLLIGISVITISLSVGLSLGLVAGWFGGILDSIFLFVSDIFLAFPGFLLAVAIAAFLPPSIFNVIFVLSLVGWVSFARLVRGEVLALKQREFILAARVVGMSRRRLFIYHLIPNLAGPLLVQATFGMAGVILVESTLAFLGLSVPPTTPSWGGMLDQGTQYLLVAPHLSLFPGIFIMAVVLGFNFLGDGLRDKLDPRHVVQEEI